MKKDHEELKNSFSKLHKLVLCLLSNVFYLPHMAFFNVLSCWIPNELLIFFEYINSIIVFFPSVRLNPPIYLNRGLRSVESFYMSSSFAVRCCVVFFNIVLKSILVIFSATEKGLMWTHICQFLSETCRKFVKSLLKVFSDLKFKVYMLA